MLLGRSVKEDAFHIQVLDSGLVRPFGVSPNVLGHVANIAIAVVYRDVAHSPDVRFGVQLWHFAQIVDVWPPRGRSRSALRIDDDHEVEVRVGVNTGVQYFSEGWVGGATFYLRVM